jgi:hypothetical protein
MMHPFHESQLALDHIAALHEEAAHERLLRSVRPRRRLRTSLGVRLVSAGLRLLDAQN